MLFLSSQMSHMIVKKQAYQKILANIDFRIHTKFLPLTSIPFWEYYATNLPLLATSSIIQMIATLERTKEGGNETRRAYRLKKWLLSWKGGERRGGRRKWDKKGSWLTWRQSMFLNKLVQRSINDEWGMSPKMQSTAQQIVCSMLDFCHNIFIFGCYYHTIKRLQCQKKTIWPFIRVQ